MSNAITPLLTPDERAGLVLKVLLGCPESEEVACLQALQRLVQEELARIWGERNDGPGHVLRGDVKG